MIYQTVATGLWVLVKQSGFLLKQKKHLVSQVAQHFPSILAAVFGGSYPPVCTYCPFVQMGTRSELLELIHSVGLPIVPFVTNRETGEAKGMQNEKRDRAVGEALNWRGWGPGVGGKLM